MQEIHKKRFCERCKKKTSHVVREYAMEVEYQCEKCNQQVQIVKTFF